MGKSLTDIMHEIGLTKLTCALCKKELLTKDAFTLSTWLFHLNCYKIILHRLIKFMDIILLPQEEFEQWLSDDEE